MTRHASPLDLPTERRRVVVSGAVGLAAGTAFGATSVWELSVLCGWVATTACLLVWTWRDIGPLDAETTAALATREDNSRTATWILLLSASATSLIAVGVALHRAASAGPRLDAALTVVAMLSIALSWTTVHTVFALRYAHLYYGGHAVGGIEFPGTDRPRYHDFAYLGFTVGMTFQVSDTGITTTEMRATVLRHALISFLFGTAIIATTINVVAGIVR